MNTSNQTNELFSLMAELGRLEEPKKIIGLFMDGFNRMLKGCSLTYGDVTYPSGALIYELATIRDKYGYFVLSGDLSDFSEEMRNLLGNSIMLLSIILENADHREKLHKKNIFLEAEVADRTAHLEQALNKISSQANLLDMVGQAVISTDYSGTINYWNAFAEKLLGWKKEEVLGKTIYGTLFPDQLMEHTFQVIQTLKKGEIWKGEAIIKRKNGDCFPAFLTDAPVLDDNGNFIGAVGILSDSTEIKNLMVSLKESEESFRLLVEKAPIGVFVQVDFKFAFINPEACRLWDAESAEQVLGRNVLELLSPEHHEYIIEKTTLLNEKQIAVPKIELKFLHVDGSPFYAEVTTSPLNFRGRNGSLVFFSDITDRKKAEENLRENEKQFRMFIEKAPLGIFFHYNYHFDFINPAAVNFFGADNAEQLIGTYVYDRVPPEVRTLAISRGNTLYNAKMSVPTIEHEYIRLDNSRFNVEVSAVPMNFQGNNGALVFFNDITKRKKAEEMLRENEERFRAFIENAPLGVFVHVNGIIKFINPEAVRLLGAESTEEMLETSIYDFVCMEYHGMAKKRNSILCDEIKPVPVVEQEYLRKDGSRFFVDVSAAPINYKNENSAIAFFRDTTTSKQLEEQLLHAQKMETIGRLAGGIAHDFNNILTVINANAELPLMNLSPGEIYFDEFVEIRKYAMNAADLTRKLLAFSRKQIIEPKIINLNTVLLDMDKMLRRIIGENIELVTITDDKLDFIKVDPGQVEQLLTNLVVNARDAIDVRGKLTIETKNAFIDEEYAMTHSETVPGKYVMFSVTDNGCGMTKDILEHIFDPFFTTKPKGSGTGLGLSTCYGIVKQNNGSIWVYSEPGIGTSIKVYLPAIETKDAPVSKLSEDIGLPRGNETILLVEDETGIMNIVRHLLITCGYTLHTASNGFEALSVIHKISGKIDLLITDVIMPLMGGKELADNIYKKYPHIKILFMSGYTDNAIVHQGVLDDGVMFIQKPFPMHVFARKVRECLDK